MIQMERTPCHWAAMHGHLEILAMLIKANCELESSDKVRVTVVEYFVVFKLLYVVYFQFGMRPVLVAGWYGHKGAVQMLVETKVNCKVVNKVSSTTSS